MSELKQMPVSIIVENKRIEADANIRKAIRNLQGAVSNLSKVKEYTLPKDIKEITSEDLTRQIDLRLEAVQNELGLTEEEKQTRLRSWRGVKASASRYVQQIQAVLVEWPQLSWKWYEPANNFILDGDIDAISAKMATREVSEVCSEHYKLINEASEAVLRLREFQNQSGFRLDGDRFMQYYNDPEALAEAWLNHQEMQKWLQIQNRPSGAITRDGTKIEQTLANHRAIIRKQQEETEQLRRDFINRGNRTQEMKLGATPINF